MSGLLVASLLAGMLTILAPCVVSIIPVLLARGGGDDRNHSPFWVIFGLSISIIIFTVLLKASSLLIDVPADVWKIISGGIIALFGVLTIFPGLWEAIVLKTRLVFGSQNALGAAQKKRGVWGDVLIGASLGPVFSACSPTYALIVATILPVNPLAGLLYLACFVTGLAIMLALLAVFGNALVRKLGWGLNPRGVFRRILGSILLITGIMIIFGLDKALLGFLVESGVYDFQIELESKLR